MSPSLRGVSDRRKLIQIVDDLRLTAEVGGDVSGATVIAIEGLDAIASAKGGLSRPTTFTTSEATAAAIETLSNALQADGALPGLTTGLRELDDKTLGFQRQEFAVIGARPSTGKSAVLESFALNMARKGHSAIFFSLEMSREQIGMRAISDIAYTRDDPIPYFAMRRGRIGNRELTEKQTDRLIDAARQFESLPILWDEQPALTVSQIAARARKYQLTLERQGQELDAVFIDHLHIIKAGSGRNGNRVQEVGDISGSLKTLAKELNVAVIAAAQLRRDAENNERPTMSDLKWSGEIEQDSDQIILLFRKSYQLERQIEAATDQAKRHELMLQFEGCQDEIEFIVAKQRSGPIGTVRAFIHLGCNALRDLPGGFSGYQGATHG